MSTVDDARYTRIIHCRLCCNLQILYASVPPTNTWNFIPAQTDWLNSTSDAC